MSRADLERLTSKIATDPALAEETSELIDAQAWLEWAAEHGYSLSEEEAAGLHSSNDELDDEDLEQVAGGWDGSGG